MKHIYWWIAKDVHGKGIVFTFGHLSSNKSAIGPYWTREEAQRVLRRWI